ncbi:MAG TPA: ATPase domain-containing protein [Bacteriovoracaceae bacterium]|nr:ATPase domain-containing protein [Bacteriovoracaceae bacterium]
MPKTIPRIETGVPRLDFLLNGGFFQGGVYIIQGQPGMGKTILANQCCYHRAKCGEISVYISILAETTGRMTGYLSALDFVDQDAIGKTVHYVSGYQQLKEKKLSEFKEFVRSVIKEHKAQFLVIDGLDVIKTVCQSEVEYREFLHSLQSHATLLKCTTLLLKPTGSNVELTYLEHALSDGVIDIIEWRDGARAVREIQILKMRGSNYLKGGHEVEITSNGFIIHPRTEVQFGRPSEGDPLENRVRMPFGVPQLDAMLHGGLLSGSLTTLFGTPGTGKTSLGLSFLIEGASKGEQGIYFGFYEAPPRLVEKATSLGLDLKKYVDKGLIELQWQASVENIADSLAERLLEGIRENRKKNAKVRVFIDGMSGFRRSMAYPERFGSFMAALSNELRNIHATTLFSEEAEFFSSNPEFPNRELGSVVDNVIFLRYFELHSKIHRLISILKMRDSSYESEIREFIITEQGLVISHTFASAEALLTGHPRINNQQITPVVDTSTISKNRINNKASAKQKVARSKPVQRVKKK